MGRQTLDVCTPDSPRPWFGEMSLWLRQPRAADAAALERSLVLSLQMREFDRFTALMPAFKRVCEVEAGAFAVLNHLSLVQAGTHPGARSAISPLAKRSKTVRLPADGSNPTLLDAYGGFEISMLPYYSAGVGAAWLEKGGVKVIANIRGGGEYGERSWN